MSWRRAALAAAWIASTGCFHARHVAKDQGDEGRSQGDARGGEKREQGSSPRDTRGRAAPRAGRPAVAATPEGLMNPGSARQIQEALQAKGYLDEVTGELDSATSAALRRFQRASDLAETGAPDRETLRRLGVDAQRVYRTTP